MVLYRIRDDGSAIKRHLRQVPPTATLVGWNDGEGDPVFVAVLPRNEGWSIPDVGLSSIVAWKEMKRRLGIEMSSKPDYTFKGKIC